MEFPFTKRYELNFTNYQIDSGNKEGYFARCYKARDAERNQCVAIKFLRNELRHPETMDIVKPYDFHYEAFCREADFLNMLALITRKRKGMAWVPELFGFGYLKGLEVSQENKNPTEGIVEELSDLTDFRSQIEIRMKDGWRPYLATEYFPVEKNVQHIHEFYRNLFPKLTFSGKDNNLPHLPLYQAIVFCLQVARLFKFIHKNPDDKGGPIMYPDSKLPHFFWNGRQAALIDWNRVWYSSEAGKSQYVYPYLSEENDIQHFISVPLFALLTGQDPAGKQPFFGADAEPPNFEKELAIISAGYPEEIYQLFYDSLSADRSIKTAVALENRCELILSELFDSPNKDNDGTNNSYANLQQVLVNLEEANDLISKSSDLVSNLIFSGLADTEYLVSLVDYVRERKVIPWNNSDVDCTTF